MRRLLTITLTALALVSAPMPAAAVTVTRVTVSTTATLIWTAPLSSNGRILVRNPSSVSVYVGPAGVTTANGFEIAAGDAVGINLGFGDQLYGVVAAATQVVHAIQGSNPQ